jgi:hypothetical protein
VRYEHVQYGYWGPGTVVFMLVMGVITLPEAFEGSTIGGWALVATLVAIAVITVWFSKLTVTIVDSELSAAFGPGRPHKTIDLSDVVSTALVRNSWIQGWGVRKISGGWMYNVWGLDAVEFTLKSGTITRIGTNDANNLLATVRVMTR